MFRTKLSTWLRTNNRISHQTGAEEVDFSEGIMVAGVIEDEADHEAEEVVVVGGLEAGDNREERLHLPSTES